MQPAVTIWAAARLPGFHMWPCAPVHRAYLAHEHRHLFHCKATVAVEHDDRDVEFHDLRRHITDWWGPGDRKCGSKSCETLARELAGYLEIRGCKVVEVEVSEDGECGAIYTPES